MNVIKYLIASAVLGFVLMCSSCNEPSIIGSNLLDDELLNVKFVDTSTLIMRTVKKDSVQSYAPGAPLFGYVLGTLDDPVLGYTETKFYTQFNVGLLNTISIEDAVNGVVDSAVLVLAYGNEGFYGNEDAFHTLSVHQLSEDLDFFDTLYTNMDFGFETNLLGEIQFIPNDTDSFLLVEHGAPDTSVLVGPRIRIPIETSFAEQILDTSFWKNDTLFNNMFRGLVISSNSSGESFFGLNQSADEDSELNRLMVYMTVDDTVPETAFFDLRGVRHTTFSHDYSGSSVEPFLNSYEMGDSLLFLQGLSGVEIEMDIPNLRNFNDFLINKVELEFITAELIEDDTMTYHPINNIVISRDNEAGFEQFIDDVIFGINNLNLAFFFGGFLEEGFDGGISFRKYTMNVTEEVLRILRDETRGTNLKISPFLKSERPNRSVIFGPKHSTYPARLKITFTEP